MVKHALIGGGTGFIGKRLVNHLWTLGYDITIISRMPGLRRMTWHELEKNGIPGTVSSVVNVTGQNVLDPTKRWTPGFKQNVWNSRVNSTKALSNAVSAAPNVQSFINISGVSHYPPDENKIYTEEDSVQSYDYMSRLCLAWEEAADLETGNNCKRAIVRTGVVVDRAGGMIKSIWLPFKLGLGGPMGSGKQILPWIHLEDLCRLIQFIIEKQQRGHFNAVAPEIVTNLDFSKQFASALRRPCLFNVPDFVVDLIFGKERAALLLNGAKISPTNSLKSGFEFKYPTVKAAVEEVVSVRH